jgi:IS6 family transposase
VESKGNTIDFYLSESRNKQAAKSFLKKAWAFSYVSRPRVMIVDKNPAHPVAIQELKEEKRIPEGIQIKQVRYLHNIVEQDHRFLKKRVCSMLGLKSFCTASWIISGIEAIHMIKKGRVHQEGDSAQNEIEFIHKSFGMAS